MVIKIIILAVDYGDVRTGLAICDKSCILASPVAMIEERDMTALAERIDRIAKERDVERIIVGLPRNMDGSSGFRAKKCEEFAGILSELSGIKVVMWDERGTTVYAHNLLNDTNTRGKKRKRAVDQLAASIILQDYLSSAELKRELAGL